MRAPISASDRETLRAIAAESGLGVSARPFPENVVSGLLAGYYGRSGSLKHIATEKDDTFLLESGGREFLVKISSPGEDLEIVNLQTAAMLHIRDHAPGLPVQVPIAGAGGDYEYRIRSAGGPERTLRLLTYLPGRLLADASPAPGQVRDIGAMLARVSLALRDFRHPREDRLLIWDLQRFHRMRPLLDYAGDSARRSLAQHVFDRFDAQVQPVMTTLTRQVVHGDFSPYNLLVSDEVPGYVEGIIDFGDVVRTALVFDVAVGMANLLYTDPADPWGRSLEFLGGYLGVRPVPGPELDVLPVAAQARVLLRALMAQWRAVDDPARRDYLISHSEEDWARLALARAVPEQDVTARIRSLAGGRRWPGPAPEPQEPLS